MLSTIKQIWSGLFKEGFTRNVFLLSSGALINIGLNVFLTPIVAWLYNREDYGAVALFTSVANIAVLVGTMMYPSAIVIPKENETAVNLARASFVLMGAFLALAGFLYVVGVPSLIPGIDLESYQWWLMLMPLALVILTLDLTSAGLNVRAKKFKVNMRSSVVTGALNKGITIGAGLAMGSSTIGIIAGFLISHLVGSLMRLAGSFRDTFTLNWNWTEVKAAAIRYANYPKFILPADFINRTSRDLPLYLFAGWYSLGEVGSFAFAISMLTIPYNFISASVSPVFVQRAMELKQRATDELSIFVKKINQTAFFLGILPFSILAVFGEEIFGFIFSAKWKESGEFAGYLSLYFIFRLISSPMSAIFRVFEKEKDILYFNGVLLVVRFISLFVGHLYLSASGTVMIFSAVSAMAYIVMMVMIFKLVNLSWWTSLIKYVLLYYALVALLAASKFLLLDFVL